MRTNLKMMAAVVAMGMAIVSCGNDNENFVENEQPMGEGACEGGVWHGC